MNSAPLRRPKTARGRREEKKREPKVIEDEKKAIFIKATSASSFIKDILCDLAAIKKPNSKLMTQNNPVRPFEDASPIEFLTKVNDSSLFAIGAHSKKRPHALTLGRTFDDQILDMIEFTVDPNSYRSIQDLSRNRKSIARLGAKPMLLFVGDAFDNDDDMQRVRSVLMDFFHIQNVDKINLAGLDRVIQVTASVDPANPLHKVVSFSHYTLQKKKGLGKFPRVVLEEAGPNFAMTFNRRVIGSSEIIKESLRTHKGAKVTHAKNVEVGQLGDLVGRIHMEKQNLDEIALSKMKSLGKGKRSRAIVPIGSKNNTTRAYSNKNKGGEEDLSDDFDKADPKSSKRQRTLPKAYRQSIISE